MTLTFADTHNMVAYLNKSDASEGFNQIIDFLNGSYIEYALTVNPTIYVSCIKQFWNTVAVKQSKDVTRLQALVDRKKVVVTEVVIRDALRLDDAEGVDYLPNEEIFTELAHIGKGCSRVETPLFEGMLVAREPEEQAQPQGADFLMSLLQEALDGCAALARRVEHLEHDKVDQDLGIIKLKTRVKKLERANKVKALKLRRLRKVGTSQRVDTSDDTIMEDVSNQGRMIYELDKDEGAVLMSEKEEKKAKEVKDITGDAQAEGRQAGIYQIDMDHAAKVLSMQDDELEVHEAVEVVTTAKLITKVVAAVSEAVSVVRPNIAAAVVPVATINAAPVKVAAASTRRRGVVIRDPEKESTAEIPDETKSKDKGKGIMVEEPKPIKKKQQVEMDEAYARKLHEELN
nr:xylulose kinase-1 [Tanacetum cinerariifolium]